MLCPVAKSALRRSSASSSALVRPRVRVTAPRPPPTFSSSPHQRHAFETSAPSTSPSGGTNTISQAEIEHFSALSANWWDPTGEFGLLHRMNPARLDFLRDELLRVDELEGARWLQGKDVLDVGCGGGIFAEVRSMPRSLCPLSIAVKPEPCADLCVRRRSHSHD